MSRHLRRCWRCLFLAAVSGTSSDGPVSGTLQLEQGGGGAGGAGQPGGSGGGDPRLLPWGGGQGGRRPWTSAHPAAKLNYQDDSFWDVDDVSPSKCRVTWCSELCLQFHQTL